MDVRKMSVEGFCLAAVKGVSQSVEKQVYIVYTLAV